MRLTFWSTMGSICGVTVRGQFHLGIAMKIAVIGTGISGMLAARLLASDHEIHVFEANDYLGGHTNTIEVEAFGRSYQLDTGFMVFNHRTYPNFIRMLRLLGVPEQDSDMSFSVRCSKTGLEYQGSSLSGLFAQRLNAIRPAFLRMLWDVLRFNRIGSAAAASGELRDGCSVGDFLQRGGFGRRLVDQYLVPMAAAIWSTNPQAIRDFPAEFLIGFFRNHGLAAGSSLTHPHTQIIATPIAPTNVRHEIEEARRHYDDRMSCVYCETIEREAAAGDRVVMETDEYFAFADFRYGKLPVFERRPECRHYHGVCCFFHALAPFPFAPRKMIRSRPTIFSTSETNVSETATFMWLPARISTRFLSLITISSETGHLPECEPRTL